MVNELNNKHLDDKNERAFEGCMIFFGFALYQAKLNDEMIRRSYKYKVALEILSYHNRCSEEDVQKCLEYKPHIFDYNKFDLNPYQLDEMEKCKGVITMFYDLFERSQFSEEVLTRFIWTVKKNYRKVHYHNFVHGWSVAQAMYVILKHDEKNCFDYETVIMKIILHLLVYYIVNQCNNLFVC